MSIKKTLKLLRVSLKNNGISWWWHLRSVNSRARFVFPLFAHALAAHKMRIWQINQISMCLWTIGRKMKAKVWKGTVNQGTLATSSEWDSWIEFKMKEVIELGFLSLKKNLPSFFQLQYLKNKLFPSHMASVQGHRSYMKRFRMKDIQWLLMSTSILLGRKKHIAELLHF